MTDLTQAARRGRVTAWVAAIFLLAAGLRVGWVVKRWGTAGQAETLNYPDEEAYALGARTLAAGDGLVDEFGYRATYMPGYPAFLAIFEDFARPLFWARIVQAVLAAWVAPATFLLARRFLNDDSLLAPILAGLAAALDPFLVFFSGLLLTEALFAAVLVTAWVFVQKWGRSSFLEMSCVPFFLWMAVMLRPSAAVLVVLTPLMLLVLGSGRLGRLLGCETVPLRSMFIRAVVIPVVVLLGLLPWAIRNHAVIGEWRWLSTRGGISLYDGLQPGATGESNLGHTKIMKEAQGPSEVEWDDYFRAAAWQSARNDPAAVLRLAGRKFLRTWSLTPNVAEYHGGAAAKISAAWMMIVLGLAAVGLWQSRRRVAAWALLLLPVVAFTLLYMVYVGSVRYRVPLMPFVMVLSAVGAASILKPASASNTTRARPQ